MVVLGWQVTNLRLIWTSHRSFGTNLTIGYSCIESISIRSVDSRLRAGRAQALYVMTRYQGSRFEFIFTSLVRESPRLFTTVQAVFRSYETSKLFRDLKLRGAVIKSGRLEQLPGEEIVERVEGVWNLSAEQGNLGVLFITNVRVVWFAQLAENFNVSIPYMQVRSIKVRDSRFGRALVIDTLARAGGYVLGFRVDPPEKLSTVFRALSSLHMTHFANPIFGVRYTVEEKAASLDELRAPRVSEDAAIIEEADGGGDSFAAYVVGAAKTSERPPVFDAHLGLAVEALPDGFTTKKLWTTL